jgi:hypothetical protein
MRPEEENLMAAIHAVDAIQKTWNVRGEAEYERFKLVTRENRRLIETLRSNFPLKRGEYVLDVGGREGDVAFGIQKAQWVHIVDPDPRIEPLKKCERHWRAKVQDVRLDPRIKYKLIIVCHVAGYLGLQGADAKVLAKLMNQLTDDGTLVIFYNINDGYMGELLEYSKHIYPVRHWDYFDEKLLDPYKTPACEIKRLDVSFTLDYKTFDELALCCWFLFGAINRNIKSCAKLFITKLKSDLLVPRFEIAERMIFVTKKKWTMRDRRTFR